jgi:hypothetical protein
MEVNLCRVETLTCKYQPGRQRIQMQRETVCFISQSLVTEGTWEGWWLAESPIRRDLGIYGPLPRPPATAQHGQLRANFPLSHPLVVNKPASIARALVLLVSTLRLQRHPPLLWFRIYLSALRRKRCFPRRQTWRAASREPALELALAQASTRNPTHGAEPSLPRPVPTSS